MEQKRNSEVFSLVLRGGKHSGKFTTILLLILLCIGTNVVSAQETAYEKKKAALQLQILTEFGQYAARVVYSHIENKSDEEVFAEAEGAKIATDLVGSRSEYRAMIWYAGELKKAQNLKTAVDIQREKETKALREKEVAQKATQEEYENSDRGYIERTIKYEFDKWNQKGEFEKQSEYEERLKTKSENAFIDVCIKQMKKEISNYINDTYSFWSYNGNQQLLKYDTEKEMFLINLHKDIQNHKKTEWQVEIEIPIAKAKDFQKEWSSGRWKTTDCDWYYTDNTLAPNKLALEINSITYIVNLPLENPTEISFKFDDFGIDNQYLSGYVLKFSKAKAIAEQQEREKQRLDSLERAAYIHQNEYRQNGKLFASETEFDSFYTKGKGIYQAEVEKRTILKYFLNNAKFIESMDFQKEAKETIGSAFMASYIGSNTDYSKINADRKKILSAISESKNKSYYSQLLDFIIETNKGLNKEWSKNGQYFDSKSDFYNAFLSDMYKQVLKDKKKK